MESIAEVEDTIREAYAQTSYLDMRSWSDERLQTRKEEIYNCNETLWKNYGEASHGALGILSCEYHDIDEEQDTRTYYKENPSPTRREYAETHRLNLTNL